MKGRITALKVQKRSSKRINVYLDGKFAFGLSRIVSAWLKVGQDISNEQIDQLLADDKCEVEYQYTLKLLSYRIRSEEEVRRKLKRRDTPTAIIDEVINRLKKNGLIDDEEFAKRWVENRNDFRPRGKRALQYELRKKGLANQIIERVLENIDEERNAYQAARKRINRLSKLEWSQFRKKLYSHLARRGFNYDITKQVTKRLWKELHPD